MDVLNDGKEHGVMVELRYPPESKDSSVVGMDRFIAERWQQRREELEARPAPAPRGSLRSGNQAQALPLALQDQ